MITSLHIARGIERQLEALQRSGKKGEKAAENFRAICQQLRQQGPEAPELLARRTKNGELRVKNCIKYHLGHGYRLVTIRIGDGLYLPVLGSHDEVDLWLDLRRREGFAPQESGFTRELLHSAACVAAATGEEDGQEGSADSGDVEHLPPLDERLLREVFRGLCQQRQPGEMSPAPCSR
jgi:hypothetical protein